jgi:cytoskeletal protein CcmA (bactofilin family)
MYMKRIGIFLLILILPLFIALPVYAQSQNKNVLLGKDEVVNKDYFAGGETVTVLGTVNGDAYVAGGTVLVDGTINGDLLVAGGNVTVNGTVAQDVRAAGGNVTINGKVGQNVTMAGGNITLANNASVSGSVVMAGGQVSVLSSVGKGATLAGGQVTVGNSVGGDVWAGVGTLTLTPDANVAGNLHYISDTDATVLSGATIAGQTSRETPPQKSKDAMERSKGVAKGIGAGFIFASFLSALVLGFLLITFFPRFMDSSSEQITKNPWRALGVGFLTYALFPFVFILLLITLVGIPLALILLFAILLIAYLSKIFFAYYVGKWIAQKLNWKSNNVVTLLLGLVVYYILTRIPVIGGLTFIAFLLIGTGALLLTKKEYYTQLRSKNSI